MSPGTTHRLLKPCSARTSPRNRGCWPASSTSTTASAKPNEQGWLGEVDGLKVSLDTAHQKVVQMRETRARTTTTDLPTPKLRPRQPR